LTACRPALTQGRPGAMTGAMEEAHTAVDRAERAIKAAAAATLPHASLVLFGSRARGTAGRRSDFDLAVIPRPGFSSREHLAFVEQVDESPEIIHPVDIVLWPEASSELRRRIQNEGISWKS
jgi:predicted nucleotidyltransferase